MTSDSLYYDLVLRATLSFLHAAALFLSTERSGDERDDLRELPAKEIIIEIPLLDVDWGIVCFFWLVSWLFVAVPMAEMFFKKTHARYFLYRHPQ